MDIQHLSFPLLPVILSFLCFAFMALRLSQRLKLCSSSTVDLPPGPYKLPIIGNLHQLATSLPHRVLRTLAQKHGPLMHLKLGQVSSIIVSSPELAQEVMKTHDLIFASRPHIAASRILSYNSVNIAFSPYGDYWRQLRKICTLELLSVKRVQSLGPLREEEMSNLIKSISACAGTPINLTSKVFSLAYGFTSKAAFGEKVEDQNQLIKVLSEAIVLGSGFNVADLFPSFKLLHLISGVQHKLEKLFAKTDKVLQKIVDDHKSTEKQSRNEDLVDVLLKYYDDAGSNFSLSDNNIKAVLLDIVSAGSETSSNEVNWAMAEMMRNPRIMEKAQAEVRQVYGAKGKVDGEHLQELKYLKLVIKETLRLHPAVPLLLPRINSEKCEIGGYQIPANTKLIINAWAINRDPNYWTDAETFNPERFINSATNYTGSHFEYIPFGAGRRICPGISFGLANVELQLASLLFHFDWKLPHGMKPEELDMTETFGVTAGLKQDLYLIPVAAN